jgi:hypothetical protein
LSILASGDEAIFVLIDDVEDLYNVFEATGSVGQFSGDG